MAEIPRDPGLDASLALLREGYEFIPNRCRRYRSDAFETRLGLQPAVCMQGAGAASLMYSDRFTRRQAVPRPIMALLQDVGSVQQLDGEAHRHRKGMFLSLMAPDSIARLVQLADEQWRIAAARWERAAEVVLLEAVEDVLCRSVCAWAGVPLLEGEAARRAADFAAMIDGAGAVGPRNWRGQLARRRTERWVTTIVRRIRAGQLSVPDGSAAHVIAWHRDLGGGLLDDGVATVEIINVLRPTVAVARFVMFSALALHQYPDARERLLAGGGDELQWFVQEVRRFYPFFPAVAGRVREEFEWRGYRFPVRRWAMLGIYATHRDPETWDEPDAFRPERFRGWDGNPFTLIPQGAGRHTETHRCPGEWITVELMKLAVRALTQQLRYEVPPQDLRMSLSRIPAQPASRFVVRNVEPTA